MIKIKPPCDNIINTEEFFRETLWIVELKDGTKVAADIIDDKFFSECFKMTDILSGEILVIPISNIYLIRRKDIVGIGFNCPSNKPKTLKTEKFVCFYEMPIDMQYKIDDYGIKPIKWFNIESMEEIKEIKKELKERV